MWKTYLTLCCLLGMLTWPPASKALSLVMSPYIEHLKHNNKRDCEAAGGSFIKWYDEIYCRRENPILKQTISQAEFASLSSEQIDNKLAALGLPPIGGIGYFPGNPLYKLNRQQINSLSPQQIQRLYDLSEAQIKSMSAADLLHWVAPINSTPP